MEAWLAFLKENFSPLQAMAGAILGFLSTRWTMTKKERSDANQKLFENGRDLMLAQHERYLDFTAVFQKYIQKEDDPTFDDFMDIARVGDSYFYQQKIISNAILAGKVDAESRDATLVPRLADCVNSNLPNYYKALQSIARRKGFPYSGKLERKNYESLYAVVEKYANLQAKD